MVQMEFHMAYPIDNFHRPPNMCHTLLHTVHVFGPYTLVSDRQKFSEGEGDPSP